MSHERITVDVRGHQAPVLVGGAGPDLFFLHGGGGADEWGEFHEHLATRFRVFAPTQPGFAGTPLPRWLRAADDVALYNFDLLRTLHLSRPHLVGLSMGGWVATEMAVFRSHALRSLTLMGAVGVRPEQPIPDPFIMEPGEAVAVLFADPSKAMATFGERAMTVDGIVRSWSDQAAVARLMWKRPYNINLRRRLHHIDVPTAVVWGRSDALIPLAHGELIAREIPGARFYVIEDAGHIAIVDQPQASAEAIIGFIEALQARRSQEAR